MHARLQSNLLRPRLAEAHDVPPSRYVTSPHEELLRFENFERAVIQSANTKDGEVAPLPARPRLLRIVR